MKNALVIGGLVAIAPQLWIDTAQGLFTYTNGQVNLPGVSYANFWINIVAVIGYVLLLVGLFL